MLKLSMTIKKPLSSTAMNTTRRFNFENKYRHHLHDNLHKDLYDHLFQDFVKILQNQIKVTRHTYYITYCYDQVHDRAQ